MHNYKTITTSLNADGVAELVLNKPELHNAFDDQMIGELIAALKNLAADPAVRLLLLKSNGKNFSAGADLNWMRSMAEKNYQQNLEDAAQLAELMQQLDNFPAPTIALVQGAAFGGALGLVSCCDIAIAEQASSFCLSEVKIGLIPAVISPYVMRALGERACRRYFLTAERFDATTALNLGLVHQVVDAGGLAAAANYFVELLLKNSPAALRCAKELMAAVYHQPIQQQLIDSTAARIAAIRVSAEGQEGLNAFLQKRTPAWIRSE
jgi:methylglutaconyl-CoA hydratase